MAVNGESVSAKLLSRLPVQVCFIVQVQSSKFWSTAVFPPYSDLMIFTQALEHLCGHEAPRWLEGALI